MRRDAREAAFRYLYSYLITGEEDGEIKEYLFKEHKLDNKDVEYVGTLISDMMEREEEFISEISNLSERYNIERINYPDKAALLIAMTEIVCFEDIDVAVSIDEAVKLVKKYSSENSLSFVNGILGEFARRRS